MGSLFDFSDNTSASSWRVINDGVMGGLSRSELVVRDGLAVFEGTVRSENNGGFASARSLPASLVPATATAIVLRIRGDGRRYQFRVRTDDRWDGVAYKHDFNTKAGEWQTLALPFSEFRATYRGRGVLGAPALNPAEVRQLGFLIADKQFGPFRLEVDWIRTR